MSNKMMNIQKKGLEHIYKTLDSFDGHAIRVSLVGIMIQKGIESAIQTDILNVFQDAIFEEEKKITESKEWLDCIIEDEI